MPRVAASAVLEDLGWRVAELRRARGWTQEQLAERMDLSLDHLKSVERGRENLTVLSLVGLAAVLGVPTAALLEAPTERPPRRPGRPRRR